MALKAFQADDNKVGNSDGRADKMVINSSSQNSTYMPNISATRESNFPTPDAKKALNRLK